MPLFPMYGIYTYFECTPNVCHGCNLDNLKMPIENRDYKDYLISLIILVIHSGHN